MQLCKLAKWSLCPMLGSTDGEKLEGKVDDSWGEQASRDQAGAGNHEDGLEALVTQHFQFQ